MKRTGIVWTAMVLTGVLFAARARAASAAGLAISQAGPEGEVARMEEANEIRILFSEPMVALGRVPDRVTAPFVHIDPAIPGLFRWSGTRLLIFTPAEGTNLPFATKYTVTVDRTAASIDGRKLDQPYVFNFTTPTVHLVSSKWYRKSGRYDSPAVLVFRFNQKVSPQAVAAHVHLHFAAYDWTPPKIQDEVRASLVSADPKAMKDFQSKVAQTKIVTRSSAAIAFLLAADWDKQEYPAAAEQVVFETKTAPPPQAQILAELDEELSGIAGKETPGATQSFTFKMEPAFFVEGFDCASQCSDEFYNAINFRGMPVAADLLARLVASDITDAAHPQALSTSKQTLVEDDVQEADYWEEEDSGAQSSIALDRFGFPIKPARTYLFRIGRDAKSTDGQTLGYTWVGQVEYWHESAFTSLGSGHGVWESGGGSQLPFSVRNLTSVKEWIAPVHIDDLVPTILKVDGAVLKPDGKVEYGNDGSRIPPAQPIARPLKLEPDAIQSVGLNISKALSGAGTGFVWAGVLGGDPIQRSVQTQETPTDTLVQVTNLGISVKDSPQNTLIFVTSLDKGAPVEGAEVSIRTLDNKVFWSGVTDRDGIAIANNTDMRTRLKIDSWEAASTLSFVVTAKKGEDVAYVCSNWNEGIQSWDFGLYADLDEAKPQLRGSVFPDRGVYKLGEEIHFKAILRSDTTSGIRLLPAGTKLKAVVKNADGNEVNKQTLTLSEWSTTDWVVKLPEDGALGEYRLEASVEGQQGSAWGGALVAAYRKPDFRVDANLGGADDIAGAMIKGVITAKYLFGAPMSGKPVHVRFSKRARTGVPEAVTEHFPSDKYAFLKEAWDPATNRARYLVETLSTKDGVLEADGSYAADLTTELKAGVPYTYAVNGEVTDVSRQTISGQADFVVHPAPWYLGLKRPFFFVTAKDGLRSDVVAVTPRGVVTPGVKVTAILSQAQWNSVRHAEGNGFYWWESKRVDKEVWRTETTTGAMPAPIDAPLSDGGLYVLAVTATDPDGRTTTTNTDFYVLGEGYTAWERYDHNRIDLVPDHKTYRPGDTARIIIKSPWESATALLTTEREGIRSHREFTLTSTQQTVEVPVTESDIPNFYVSVLLVRGRTDAAIEKDGSDPGKPAFRLGYVQVNVENSRKRLSVEVASDKEEYRPAETATVSVRVKDCDGKPVTGEVTLWAVDYGVLSLTGYTTPDVLDSVYADKALQVMTQDSRINIVSRRVISPKGQEEGGGGGFEEGSEGKVRKDFRVLAFWLGSVVTDASGALTVKQKLPESLTTYRIMAVVNDKANRFGWGEREIRLSKPVLLTPAFPRFLAMGDKAYFGAVIHNQLKDGGKAIVSMKSLDPGVLVVSDDATRTVDIAASGTVEARFHLEAKTVGTGRLLMSVQLRGEEDSFELPLPVRSLRSPEITAAYGTASPDAKEILALPQAVLPNFGGLHIELASTAMVGLGEGASYLVDYPYGCAEQRASATLALLLTSDLGGAFHLPDVKPEEMKKTVETTLKELPEFQCSDGGFAYWKGGCPSSSAYLTSYILHVLQRAVKSGYAVPETVLNSAYDYLDRQLGTAPKTNEAYLPSYTAWQAFATKVLAEGGRNVDSHITRLFGYRDTMPVFGLCHLLDAVSQGNQSGQHYRELRRRIQNAMLMEGGSAHIEEYEDPYLVWFWNSNVRSTAISLGSLVRDGGDANVIQSVVRWLMAARKDGRWGNTQENAYAMESLVDYYRKFESEVPDFTAVVSLAAQTLQKETFKGRETKARTSDLPMEKLRTAGTSGESLPLTFHREGTGTLFYAARLKYASTMPLLQPLDSGIRIDRSYEPFAGGSVSTTFKAGDLVQVTITLDLTKERRWVAVTDPIPAGFEPVESWFKTTSAELAEDQRNEEEGGDWMEWWARGGFDHVERHDDRVMLFATMLSEGRHSFRYVCRATTAGQFRTAPARAEEMYEPEVFGRTATTDVEVKP